MNIKETLLLTDENIDPDLVQFLRSEGFNVLDVVENNLGGASDEQILEIAHQQNRAVVTHDRDFGSLTIAEGKPYFGIIFLRPGQIDITDSIRSFTALLTNIDDVVPPFIIVVHNSASGIRIRYRHK